MHVEYRTGNSSQIVSSDLTLVSFITLTAGSGGTGDITVRDGDSSTARQFEVVKVPASEIIHLIFPHPVRLDNGLFIEVGSNVARWTVGYRVGTELN